MGDEDYNPDLLGDESEVHLDFSPHNDDKFDDDDDEGEDFLEQNIYDEVREEHEGPTSDSTYVMTSDIKIDALNAKLGRYK